MSRIYEALQRAEAERSAGLQPDELEEDLLNPLPAVVWTEPYLPSPTTETLAEIPQTVPSAIVESSAPGLTPASAPASAPLHATVDAPLVDPTGIDLDSIASAPWKPVLEHLPAVQDRGRTVEQFRSLRSRMQEFRGANHLKSILVTSGLPQEGKSFVAVNLAISLARHKISRVLLIDGDMRRSSLHRILGCPNDGPGLTEYLSGQASLQQIMKRPEPDPGGAPLPLGFGSLIFIGAGSEADKAADLSGNHRFDELMAIVSPLFDWVIVDSSPVNLVSDGVNLARACNGVLLIARGEVTKFETAQQAVAALEATKILGVVLNAVNNDFASSGYYDYDSTAEKK